MNTVYFFFQARLMRQNDGQNTRTGKYSLIIRDTECKQQALWNYRRALHGAELIYSAIFKADWEIKNCTQNKKKQQEKMKTDFSVRHSFVRDTIITTHRNWSAG